MKISQDWINDPQLKQVLALLNSDGGVGYLVGGCVRNALMEKPTTDIDIATSFDPKTVSNLAKSANFKVIPTGIDHGTVTVVTDAGPLEITTFRQDIETDGRHAIVAFTTDIAKDASRRDFTMNALYGCANGDVIDPLGGLDDLQNGHVRFIGDPIERIEEDYLRILRFFRFTAIYGDPVLGIDEDGLAACAQCLDGLGGVSKERIGSEVLKLLGSNEPSMAIAAMGQINVLQRILPGADPKYLPILVHAEHGFDIDPIRRLAVLGGQSVKENLRLSKKQNHHLSILQNAQDPSGARTGFEHGYSAGLGAALISATYAETSIYAELDTVLRHATSVTFPIAAQDISHIVQGPDLGNALTFLKDEWISSGFELTKAELMQRFLEIQDNQTNGD